MVMSSSLRKVDMIVYNFNFSSHASLFLPILQFPRNSTDAIQVGIFVRRLCKLERCCGPCR